MQKDRRKQGPVWRCITAASWTALVTVIGLSPLRAESVTIRVADSLPTGHFLAEFAARPWMDAVTRRSGGKVLFQYFPAEQLGKAKDLLSLTQSGVTDVGYVVPAYVPDKMPLSSVAELPGSFQTSCEGTAAFWTVAKDGILAKAEFAPNAVRPLFAVVLSPYQIFTSNRTITDLKSLEGLKLQTTGGAKDAMVRKLKSVPVRVAGPEMYEALSRGTIDGLLLPYASIVSYDLHGLVRHATLQGNFGSVVTTYVISEARWRALPESVRTTLAEAGEEITRTACRRIDDSVQSDIEKLRGHGVAMHALPASDVAAFGRLTAEIGEEWASAVEKRGKPGREVLAAFRRALQGG